MSKPNGDKMMTHYINIENGVLKYMRTMPEKPKGMFEDNEKSLKRYHDYDQALANATADSVEIADQNYAWGQVVYEVEKSSGPRPTLRSDLEGKIIEITTNGVFEVREQFRVRDKSIWIDGVTENQRDKTFLEFRQLAYYKEEAKPEQPEAESQMEIWKDMLEVSTLPYGYTVEQRIEQVMIHFTITRKK